MKLGMHVSIKGSVDMAVDRAKEKGCNTFQIFTRNPRGWKFKDLTEEEVRGFTAKRREYGIEPAIAHMPYLPNLASPKDDVYTKSVYALTAELKRCELLEIPYLVTHLGSHLGAGMERGFKRITEAIRRGLSEAGGGVMLLLETTAGTKNSMGGRFEDIAHIIELLEGDERLGVCFDTCHAFAAGYDLRTEDAVDETAKNFDETIGLRRLKVVHVSDCQGDLNSRLDRHEHVGMGFIGDDGFRAVLRHNALRELPFILETPIDARRDDYGNLEKLRELSPK